MSTSLDLLRVSFVVVRKFARRNPGAIIVLWLCVTSVSHAAPAQIRQFAMFEQSFEHAGGFTNPYVELDAEVELIGPDGFTRKLPMFWDGGRTWKFRFAPPQIGRWDWSIRSSDEGLNSKSGSLDVVESDVRGGLERMPKYPHHFQYQNGEPCWFLGDTAWALFTDDKDESHDRAAVEQYINARAGQGFNVVHAMLLSEAGWGNSGGPAFTNLPQERINPAYWQEVDYRLVYLNSKGITGGLVLAWADKGRNPNNWKDFPSEESGMRYARYIAARYSAADVYFIVAGEWDMDGTTADVREGYAKIGRALASSDPHRRLVTIHPSSNARKSAAEFNAELWMGFGDYQQNYTNLHRAMLEPRDYQKPVVNAEYAYYLRDQNGDGEPDKQNSTTLDSIRHASWDIVMAGGYFVTGFGTTYFGGHRDPGPFFVNDTKNDDWEEDVQHLRKFFTGLQWWKLQPHDELITSNAKRTADRRVKIVVAPPATTYWALANPGYEYVFYVRGYKGIFKLSLGDAPAGEYQVREYNPRTGEFAEKQLHRSPDPIQYHAPNAEDWVIHVSLQQ